jgi:hypothetical protein
MSTRKMCPVYVLSFMLFQMASTLGCGTKLDGIKTAKSQKIGYRIKGQEKSLTVSDGKEVTEILDTISIDHTDNRGPGWIEWNRVIFILPQGEEISVSIARKQILDGPHSGVTYLKDAKFYDKINEIVTKKEARKIDVLVDNKGLMFSKSAGLCHGVPHQAVWHGKTSCLP